MKDKIFSGKALEDALKGNAFEQSEIELTGMVKSSEKSGHISFARGDCETWVDMPTSMIDQAERLGQKKCKDHSHPHFRITLKKPANPETSLFAQLLALPLTTSPGSFSSLQAENPNPIPIGFPAGSLNPHYHYVAAGPRNNVVSSRSGNPFGGSAFGYASRGVAPHLGIGGGGTSTGGGGLYNYCWDSECCDCVPDGSPCFTDGAGRVHCPCNVVCNPCQRCIAPW
jgi:hypothetical protein